MTRTRETTSSRPAADGDSIRRGLELRRGIQAAFDRAGFEDSSAREWIEEKILNNLDNQQEDIELLDSDRASGSSTEEEEDVVGDLPSKLSKINFDSDDDSYEEDQEFSQQASFFH